VASLQFLQPVNRRARFNRGTINLPPVSNEIVSAGSAKAWSAAERPQATDH